MKDPVAFSRQFVYPKLSDKEFESVLELSGQYGLDITKGGYAVLDGKFYMTIYGMLQVAIKNGLVGNETEQGPDMTVDSNGQAYTVPSTTTAFVHRALFGKGEALFQATIAFKEYASTVSHLMNPQMFTEKWALAMALRKAFADVLPNMPSMEEMQAGVQFNDTKISKLNVVTQPAAVVLDLETDPDVAAALSDVTMQSIDQELTQMLETAGQSAGRKQSTQKALEDLFAVEAPY